MISVARRGDERAKGLDLEWRAGGGGGGVGRMEEENELEEGEAYSLQEEEEEDDDDDSCIDPDSLSYIDEKLQDVLGHFQKDFEGGVFMENLGAKYGGYGSFLPTYQRSPSILSQPSPPKLPNQNSVRFPCNSSVEGTRQNASFTPSAPVCKNNATSTPLLNNPRKTDMCKSMPNNQESISQQNFINNPTSSSDLKTLKVRIKVGPNNNLTRNNAAIYSGLGLDISPSSSFEESPDGSGGIVPGSRDLPDESPKTIIQAMTSFSVPDGLLLSPLQDRLCQLTERESLLLKKSKTGTIHKGMLGKQTILEGLMLPTRETNIQVEKNEKSYDKKRWSKEIRKPKGEIDIGTILNREIDIETPAGQELVSNALNIPLLSVMNDDEKSERQMVSSAAKNVTKTKDSSRVPAKGSSKDVLLPPVPTNDKQLELTERNIPNGINNLDNRVTHSRGSSTKENLLERMVETRDANGQADPSCNLQRDGQIKAEKDFDTFHMNSHSNEHKGKTEQIVEPLDNFKNISSHKVTSLEADRENILQTNGQTCDRKRKVKVGQSDSEPFRELSKDSSSGNSSVAAKELKATVDYVEKKVKVPKPRKQSGGITGNGRTEHLENGAGYLDSNANSKQKFVKPEFDKALIRSVQTFKEKSNSKRVENNLVSGVPSGDPIAASLTCDFLPTEATMAPQAPVVIQDNWVSCDKCHKWRLLPHGTDPDSLPKIWKCSYLDWLPGLNSCAISEEETTRALHALYVPPIPDVSASNHHIPVSGDTSTAGVYQSQNITYNIHNLSSAGNKNTVKDDLNTFRLLSHSTGAPFSSSGKKNQQTTIKTRSLNDDDHAAFETVSAIKGDLGNSSKITDLNTEKQKHKQKTKHKLVCHSDGGDFIQKSKKHSKSKSKREIDHDNIGASKKLKKETMPYADKDFHSKDDVFEKTSVENANGNFTTKMVANNQPKQSNFSLAEDSIHDMNGNSSISSKKSKGEYFSAVDVGKPSNMELSLKKRKNNEYHENNYNEEAPVPGQNVTDRKTIVKGVPSENDPLNVKKAKVSKSEGKVSKSSKLYSETDQVVKLRKTFLGSSGESLPDGMNDEGQYLAGKKHELNTCQENARRGSDVESLKRDMISVQTSTAANSSSSKVSGSRKSKAHILEGKGSPVESVSSSPVRIPSIEKLPNKKISAQVDEIILGSPKRCLDNKVDGHFERPRKGSDVHVQPQSIENQRARDSYSRGKYDNQENDANPVTDGKSVDLMDRGSKYLHETAEKNGYQKLDEFHTKLHIDNDFNNRKSGKNSSGHKEKLRGSKSVLDDVKIKVSSSYGENKESHATKNNISSQHGDNLHPMFTESLRKENCNFEEKDEKDFMKKDSLSKCSTGRQDNSSNFAMHEHAVANDFPELPTQNKGSDSRASVVGAKSSKANIQEELQVTPSFHKEKAQNHICSQRIDKQERPSRIERSYMNLPSDDTEETNFHGPGVVASALKENISEVNAVVGTNEASKVVKQSRQPDIQNGLHHSNLRHATPNGPDTSSPMRKDGHFSVSAVLKEARDLKHTANRLKTEGPESESTHLYFEAALKFLHAASLMEPTDSTKHGDAAQMYSETATLCQFVAHQYERCKEMVGAALAYKCVEVAYLKAAYCKNPTANKDRHELQAVLQMLPPGESPSSSASDVDNLNNNQGTLGKAITTKGLSSPQIAGHHAIAVRLHPQVLRLLHYTNDLNLAFEATKKSQIAIAAATVSEKRLLDGLSSVRKALDFNFHNVEGLMRVVRIAMEKISR